MPPSLALARCNHEDAIRLYRRETRPEVAKQGRTSRGFKELVDAGSDLWFCRKDEGGCGKLLTRAPLQAVRKK